jgi:hypothetical protein
MAAWSNALIRAQMEWSRLTPTPLHQLDAPQRTALEVVEWLSQVFAGERELHPDEAEALQRLDAALGPPSRRTDQLALAARLVDEHAARWHAAPVEWTPEREGQWSPRHEIANALAATLWSQVNPGFEKLYEKLDDVEGLLARHEPGHGRRTAAGKGQGKLSAAAIVVELNTLAGWPLDPNLDRETVSSAIDRAKNTSRRA